MCVLIPVPLILMTVVLVLLVQLTATVGGSGASTYTHAVTGSHRGVAEKYAQLGKLAMPAGAHMS